MERFGAVITGGATRLGAKISLALASEGFDIVIHYKSSSNVDHLSNYILSNFNVQCFAIQGDLLDHSFRKKLISFALNKTNCNTLINSASIFQNIDFLSTSKENLQDNYNVHVFAPFFLIQEMASRIQKFNIINILDEMLLKRKSSSYFAYLLSQKSLEVLTSMLEEELKANINISSVYPTKIPDEEFNKENRFNIYGKCREVTDEIISHLHKKEYFVAG